MTSLGIYAGTFDPLTLGHLDVIQRAARIFDELIIAVAASRAKNTWFSLDDRVAIVRDSLGDINNARVESFDGLLVDYAESKGVKIIVRGLRAISDFEFEFQMALTNRKLRPSIETVFLMPKEEYSYLTSSSIREIAEMGGDFAQFVPEASRRSLEAKVRS
jgi:pantetheine-phosphate adenylyltransferase